MGQFASPTSVSSVAAIVDDASFIPDLEAWDPWRPGEVAAALGALRVPWAVAGGWAIDLHLQNETRPHDDIEIVVSRDDMETVAGCLVELDWFAVDDGRAWPLADAPVFFKAKAPEKDEADLGVTLPTLTPERIEWLRSALRVVHPTQEWTARLNTVL